MIRASDLYKRYQRNAPWVLDGLALEVPDGSLFGLLGPNGAGKTTLVQALLGLVAPQSGSVCVADAAMPAERRKLAGRVGWAPQSLAFYPTLTVAENLVFFDQVAFGRNGSDARVEAAATRTRLNDYWRRRADALSGGLQRRLNLAIALLGEPALLILDEPTVGVDAQSRGFILEALRGLNTDGTTIVYTTHYLDEAQRLCDRAAIMDAGQILTTDTMPALLERAPDLEALFLQHTGTALRE